MNIINHISEVCYSRVGHFDTEEQYKHFKNLIETNITKDRLVVSNDDEIRINVVDMPNLMVEVIKVFYAYSKGLIKGGSVVNNPTKEKVARLNKCDPSYVHCDNCFYLSALAPFCCYHNCSLLNKDQACYKFKKKVK